MDNRSFYDELSSIYDVMFPYGTQQARVDFLDRIFTERGVKTALDCGCGTGRQAIDLSLRGFRVTGADISKHMLELANANARANGLTLPWLESDFVSLPQTVAEKFDAVYCIGNSLPHVEDKRELKASLAGMVSALKNDGVLVLHLRNYAAVVKNRSRLMPTLAGEHQGANYIFQRLIDFRPDGRLSFSILTLKQCSPLSWEPHLSSTVQYPATKDELENILTELGMRHVTAYGDFRGGDFEQEGENVIITARRP